jgi:hypothetical protein
MKLTEADQEREKKEKEGQVESRNRNSLNSAVRVFWDAEWIWD